MHHDAPPVSALPAWVLVTANSKELISPLESAVTCLLNSKFFRFCTYINPGGRGGPAHPPSQPRSGTPPMKRIVVLGAGFGGMQATIELDRIFRARPDVTILLLNDQNFFLFTPLLPEIASSYISPRDIVETVRDIRGRR